ncbi:MAG: secretin N-terminal domain-containing protein [Phycisphaerales bacterium]|jgi:type II secretory pathway component GspD/PulD (secretin)
MPQRTERASKNERGLALAIAAGLAISLASTAAMAQNQPQGNPAGERSPALVPEPAAQSDEPIIIGPFAEPVQLRTLLDIAVARLGVQLAVDTSLTGSVMITQELRIPPDQYLLLLNSFLEQNGFAMVPGAIDGFFQVMPKASVPSKPVGDLATTLVIRTPNTKPSVLQQAIVSQTSTDGSRIAALDELGVLIVTASPGTAMEIRDLVDRILAERDQQRLIPFELTHVAAVAARDQVLRLAGVLEESSSAPGLPDPRGRSGQPEGGGSFVSSALSNLGQRLIVAPSGNRLLFRGTEDEADRVAELISIVDVKDDLQPTRYRTGSATANVAALAEQRGLGSVIQFSSMDDAGGIGQFPGQVRGLPGQGFGQPQPVQGGSAIVVDEIGQSIVFYGTPEQHEQFAALVAEYDPGDEQVVIRNYELDWAEAEAVSTLLNELIEGASAAASGDLLPGSGQTGRQATARQPRLPDQQPAPEGAFGDIQSPDAFVTYDESTNQVMVRAPLKMQAEFRRIIETIDKRRPQVFIEAKILAVTWTDDMRLAFESQIINSGGSEGLFQTNFGLTEPSGDATDRNVVGDGLLGFTSAVIRSNYVPIVINAFQRNVNGRILASPQLLVDNNTESTIVSVEEQPTTTTSQGGETTEVSFGGFEEAGPQFTVTPRINPGGFVTLNYDLTLSNFVGSGSDGIPPPRFERTLTSESVTIPSDSTIIVGGITIEDDGKTQVRVPLLGSIPILGYLFSDTSWNDSKTTLYVFITPRVLYEPTIRDYELLTEGPRRVAELDDDVPELETYMLRVMVPKDFTPGGTAGDATPDDDYGIEIIEPGTQGS